MARQRIMLDVGGGANPQHGFINMDKRKLPGVDIVHDLEVFPWPIEDNSVAFIRCCHVIEHIKPWLQIEFMDECWRILGHDDVLAIATPYGGSPRYFQDPTHCAPWMKITPYYFVEGSPLYGIYEPKPWRIENRVYFQPYGDLEVAFRSIKNAKEKS